jgi:hypothetical protein
MEDYARTVSVERGRCFKWVYDESDNPSNCLERVIRCGWLQVGQEWHLVDACSSHSGQLRSRRSARGWMT